MWCCKCKIEFLREVVPFLISYHIPYSGKFSHGANFRIFRMKASVCGKKMLNLCECVDTYVRKYMWPKLRGVAMCVCVRACEEKKAKFNSKAISWFLRKFAHRKFPAIRYVVI